MTRETCFASVALVCAALVCAALAAGCSVVGFRYHYAGQSYTMTKENSDYHEAAVKDVRIRFGDPAAQEDVAKLQGACELLQRYAADAPDPGSFTPARDLLDADARMTCAKWHQNEETAKREREHERRRAADEARRAAHDRKVADEKHAEEEQRLRETVDRESRTVRLCDSSASARAARKRHSEILDGAPGALVRKQCSARMETQTVKADCRDTNGFTRPCTRTVSTGEVSTYVCPKSMDPEVVQLGLYQLDLLDGYPYPEDRSIRIRDNDCDEARARLEQAQRKLGGEQTAGGTR